MPGTISCACSATSRASRRASMPRACARAACAALSQGARVADAVAEAGFGSESRVYEKRGATLGMTPGAARRGARRAK